MHTVRALNAYSPPAGDGSFMHVKQNSIIHVFKKDDNTWWGDIDGQVGKFPRSEISKASSKRILRATSTRTVRTLLFLSTSLSLSQAVADIATQQRGSDSTPPDQKKKSRPFSVVGLPGRSRSALAATKKNKRASTRVDNPLFGVTTEMVGPQVATRTLPKGFDPSSFEEYLEDEDFVKLFGCSRQEYLALPDEQKACLKKQAGL